jgi:hypothetical protein
MDCSLKLLQSYNKIVDSVKHYVYGIKQQQQRVLPFRQANCKALMAPLISPALAMAIDSITDLDGTVNL